MKRTLTLWVLFVCALQAQTTITDTITLPTGDLAGGKFIVQLITGPAALPNGAAAAPPKLTLQFRAAVNGFRVVLLPTDSMVPAGQYYHVRFEPASAVVNGHMLTASPWEENWQVPTTDSVLQIKDVRTTISPLLASPGTSPAPSGYTYSGSGKVICLTVSCAQTTPNLGTPALITLTNATGLPLTSAVIGILPKANGGTGTASPGLIQGANVTISGTWPNQTIAAADSLAGYTTSGTGTTVCLTVNCAMTTPDLGTPSALGLSNAIGLPLNTGVTGILPKLSGGTGTDTPALVAGTGINITGGWPNQTIAATGTNFYQTVQADSAAQTQRSALNLKSGSNITVACTDNSGSDSTECTMGVSGVLPQANGGTGTTTPGLVAGTNVSITGSWPNQTVNAAGAGPGSSFYQIVEANGASQTQRAALNLLSGTNSTVACVDNAGNGSTDCTVESSGSGTPGFYQTVKANGIPQTQRAALNLLSGGNVAVTCVDNAGSGASDCTTAVSGVLPKTNGGTGTATPALVAGSNVSITGSWPNQTIAASAPLAGYTTSGTGTVICLTVSCVLTTPNLGTPSLVTLTNAIGLPLTTGVTGILAKANGGTGLASPALVAGSNVTISGTWPNQIINASAPLAGYTTSGTGTVICLTVSCVLTTPNLGTPSFLTLTAATGLPLTTGVTGILPTANGGTGSATPALVAGANVSITGSWPNQTIAASAPLAGYTTSGTGTVLCLTVSCILTTPNLGTPSFVTLSNGNGLPLTTGVIGLLPKANGGTGTATPALVAGSNITITGSWPNQTISAAPGSFYQTVQGNGTPLTQRPTLNLKSGANSTITCVDNTGANSTDCSISSIGGGVGTSPALGTAGLTGGVAAWPNVNTGCSGAACTALILTRTANISNGGLIPGGLPGQTITILDLQDATGGRTMSAPTNFINYPVAGLDASCVVSFTAVYDGANWITSGKATTCSLP